MKSSVAIPALVNGVPLGAPPREVSPLLRVLTLTGGGGGLVLLCAIAIIWVISQVYFISIGVTVLALIPILKTYREGRAELHLLKHGIIGEGRHRGTKPGPSRWWRYAKDRYSYDLIYEVITEDGKRVRVTAADERGRDANDDPLEVLLYDPHRPKRGALLHALPGNPQLAPDGRFVCDPNHAIAEVVVALFGVLFLALLGLFFG